MTQANQMTPIPTVKPVEVALRHGRATERAGDTTAEHVGQTATATLVEQHEEDQQTARDDEQDGEDGGHADIAYVTLPGIPNRPTGRSGPASPSASEVGMS